MKFWGIVLMCTLGAIAYGIVHDQVTIRICPEYFTVFLTVRTWMQRGVLAQQEGQTSA